MELQEEHGTQSTFHYGESDQPHVLQPLVHPTEISGSQHSQKINPERHSSINLDAMELLQTLDTSHSTDLVNHEEVIVCSGKRLDSRDDLLSRHFDTSLLDAFYFENNLGTDPDGFLHHLEDIFHSRSIGF